VAVEHYTPTKKCTKCGEIKPIVNFGKRKASKDGFHVYCKDCRKVEQVQYFQKNRTEILNKNKQWRMKNPEKTRKYTRDYQANWRMTDPDGYKLYNKKYRTAERNRKYSLEDYYRNRPARLTAAKEWRKANPETASAIAKNWRKLNQQKCSALRRSYKLRKRGAEGSHSGSDIKRIYMSQKEKCPICRKPLNNIYHVDHVMPLSRGGTNWSSNLQLLCPRCNLKKSAKDPIAFMQENGLLI
jgi:5-methylcytosine-specific restriction endonuclease McrA